MRLLMWSPIQLLALLDLNVIAHSATGHAQLNPRPPETFSVTRPPMCVCVGGGKCSRWIFYIIRSIHYVYYQCIVMGLLFPLIPKKYHRLRMTPLWPHDISTPSKFWKYAQSLTIYTKNRQNLIFGYAFCKEMLILIHKQGYKHVSC